MPQIVVEQIVDVVKVIPQEWVSERTVEQIVDVPVITEQLTREAPQTASSSSGTRARRDSTGACSAAHRGV